MCSADMFLTICMSAFSETFKVILEFDTFSEFSDSNVIVLVILEPGDISACWFTTDLYITVKFEFAGIDEIPNTILSE